MIKPARVYTQQLRAILFLRREIIASFNRFFFVFLTLLKKEAISSARSLACKLPAVSIGIDMLLRYLDGLRGAIRAPSRCGCRQSSG